MKYLNRRNNSLVAACVALMSGSAAFAGGAVQIDSCPEGAAFSQPPIDATTVPGFSDEADNNLRVDDNFSGVIDPITSVVWWGGGLNGSTCTRNPNTFNIIFSEDNGGQPGNVVASETVTTTATPTGSESGIGPILRHEATLASPVTLSSGWISVQGTGDFSCYFFWGNSNAGDNGAYSSASGSVSADYAFCLITAPPCGPGETHTADQDDSTTISLGELLRVIQLFNSGGFGCQVGTEDGYAPNDPDQDCCPHNSDYNPQDWEISLGELLRLIQFFNSGGYHFCPLDGTEDGFCVGLAP